MRHSFKLTLSAIILAALLIPSPAPAEEPAEISSIMQKAIDTRDAELAEAHLDFEKTLDNFYSTALARINQASEAGQITLHQPLPMLLGSLNSNKPATRASTRGLLGSEVRKFTLYGIRSGSFAGAPLPPEQTAGMDGGLFASLGKISTERKEFSPARLIAQDGDRAKVGTTLLDQGSGRSYYLELALEKRGDNWVVVSLDNADELMRTLIEEGDRRRQ